MPERMKTMRERLVGALDAFEIVNVPGEGRTAVQRSPEELADAALGALGLLDMDEAVRRMMAVRFGPAYGALPFPVALSYPLARDLLEAALAASDARCSPGAAATEPNYPATAESEES